MSSSISLTRSLSPFLPIELERDIFELTVIAHRGSAVRLMLVAHRVYNWIAPILYGLLTIRSSGCLALLSSRGDCFAKHVKTLCLTRLSYLDAVSYISRCQELVNLAFWNNPTSDDATTTLLAVLENHRLQRLSAGLPFLIDVSGGMLFGHSAFAQLTHLEIVATDWDDWSDISGLIALTHLTHFGYYLYSVGRNDLEPAGMVQALHTILSTTTSLKVVALLVVIIEHEPQGIDIVNGWLHRARHDNPRLVVIESPADDEIFSDWEAFVYGEPDMWTRAQNMVQEQLNSPGLRRPLI